MAAMGLVAHGGTAGLLVEILPALVLAALGVAVWLRRRGSGSAAARARDESGVEEGGSERE